MKTMRRITTLLFCLALSLIILSGCSSVATFQGSGEKETAATMRIVTADGEKLFDGKVKVVDDNPTVYMALKAAADAKDLTLEIIDEETPENMFLNGINDIVSENPNFWMYYINQTAAEAGMGTQALAEDDVVEFIYEDPSKGYIEVK